VEEIRTVLIVDACQDDLVAAGRSNTDAVLADVDCFNGDQPMILGVLGGAWRTLISLLLLWGAAGGEWGHKIRTNHGENCRKPGVRAGC
jgi:hypothetical protein